MVSEEMCNRSFCHKRSDVDEMTKENFTRNMEERIEKVNMKEDQKKGDVEMFWEQLKENGYSEDDRRIIRRRKWHKKKNYGEEKESEKKKSFGIGSGERITEEIKQL